MKLHDTPGPGNGGSAASAVTQPPPPPPPPGSPLGGAGGRSTAGLGDLRVEPPGAGGRRRIPELVLGVFLVAGCALGAVLIAAAGRERTPVLTLANDIERGHVLTEGDLKTVYVGSDSAIAYVRDGDQSDVLGMAALADLGAGTILTTRQFADPDLIANPGDGVVGFALKLDGLPTRDLATGDLVRVVAGEGVSATEPEVVIEAAVVVEVEKMPNSAGQSERWWVSVKASEQDAEDLAKAIVGDNPVQLILVRR